MKSKSYLVDSVNLSLSRIAREIDSLFEIKEKINRKLQKGFLDSDLKSIDATIDRSLEMLESDLLLLNGDNTDANRLRALTIENIHKSVWKDLPEIKVVSSSVNLSPRICVMELSPEAEASYCRQDILNKRLENHLEGHGYQVKKSVFDEGGIQIDASHPILGNYRVIVNRRVRGW